MRYASAVALLASAGVVAGCGSGSATTPHPGLAWQRQPLVVVPPRLPTDRVVVGHVRNDSSRPLHLAATRLRVRDGGGRALRSSARFTASYAHGLFGAFEQPSALPTKELIRLGRVVELRPHETAPLYVAWRMSAHTRGPIRLDYGTADLALPSVVQCRCQ